MSFIRLKHFLIAAAIIIAGRTSYAQQTVTSGNTTTPISFTGGCIYNWTNDNPLIGLAASGTGNIASFTAVNAGSTPVTAHITATPVAGNMLYVSNNYDSKVYAINLTTNAVLATIPVNLNPNSVILSPDKTKLYVVNGMVGTTSVTVINTINNTVSKTIPLPANGAGGLVISPDGSTLYIASYNTNQVYIVNTSTNAVAFINGITQPSAIALNPDGKTLYVGLTGGGVSAFDTGSNTISGSFLTGRVVTNMVVSPDGKTLYAGLSSSNNIIAVNLVTGAFPPIGLPSQVRGIAISPDGNTIYAALANGTLGFINTSTFSSSYITIGTQFSNLIINPTGTQLYLTDGVTNQAYVVDIASQTVINTIRNLNYPLAAAVIPQGASCNSLNYTITVNPASPINTTPVTQQTVTSGNTTTPISFAGTCTYNWTNDNPSVGLAASGTGNIPSFTAVNNTGSSVTAHIQATPQSTGGFIYISNYYSANVTLVNAATNTVVKTIPVGQNPMKCIVSLDGQYVYVINYSDNNVSVISTASNTVIKTINAGHQPIEELLSQDGSRLYVLNRSLYPSSAGTISVINTSTNAVINTITVGQGPAYAVFSPDGKYLWVQSYDISATVFVVNLTTGLMETTIAARGGGDGAVMSVDGSKYYYLQELNGPNFVLTVINTANRTLITDIPAGGQGVNLLLMRKNGASIYVPNGVNSIAVISTATNTVTSNIPVGGLIASMCESLDQKYIYAADYGAGKILVISTTTNTVTSTVPLNGAFKYMAMNADGSRLYVSGTATLYGGTGVLAVINTATNSVIANISSPDQDEINTLSFSNGGCNTVNYSLIVNTGPPAIITSGTPNPPGTSFGTQSSSTSFNVSGNNLTAGILVTAPTGFEVSTDNVHFSPTITVGGPGILASTPVYIRLLKADNAGSYTGTINLTSAGATPATVIMPSSTVSKIAIDVTGDFQKYYGESVSSFTAYYYDPGTSDLSRGLANGNTFYSMDVALNSAASSPVTPAGIYTNAVTFSNYQGANGFLPSNYIITYHQVNLTIVPAALTIKANDIVKDYGVALTSPGAGSTAFSITGIQNSETVGTATINYGAGAAANAAAGTYTGSVVPSALTGGTFAPTNYAVTYTPGNLKVNAAPPPVIVTAGVPASVNTVYGDPSTSSSFTVSATNLTAAILVAPPTGFEVSTDNITFSPTVSIGAAGSITNVPVYIRLAAITDANTYSGPIVLTSGSATQSVPMPASMVSPAPLTITARDTTKNYGQLLSNFAGTGTGYFRISSGSLKNGNTITTIFLSYGSGGLGVDLPNIYPGQVTITDIGGSNGFKKSNYNIAPFVPGNIIVKPLPLTISPKNESKTYGDVLVSGSGSTKFVITTGHLVNNETIGSVTITYSNGATATDAAGQYPGVITVSSPTGGSFVPEGYTITVSNAADLTVNKVTLTVTADNQTRLAGDPNPIFTLIYSGFVNGDDENTLSVMPAGNTSATTDSKPGKYAIIPGGGLDGNYDFKYVNGTLTVTAKPFVVLITPNTFTPNGDGVNDLWLIKNVDLYPNCTVDIFSRSGVKVFTSVGYSIPWDGTTNGKNVPVGTYYYVIDYKTGAPPLGGSVTIIR